MALSLFEMGLQTVNTLKGGSKLSILVVLTFSFALAQMLRGTLSQAKAAKANTLQLVVWYREPHPRRRRPPLPVAVVQLTENGVLHVHFDRDMFQACCL